MTSQDLKNAMDNVSDLDHKTKTFMEMFSQENTDYVSINMRYKCECLLDAINDMKLFLCENGNKLVR